MRFIALLTKAVRNYRGTRQGYGCCPNCGDSWSWKKVSGIIFHTESLPPFSCVSFEVMICQECVKNPVVLDETRIIKDLKMNGWKPEKLSLVHKAVGAYKTRRFALN